MLVLIAGAAFAYFQFFRSSAQTVEATLLPPIAQPGADPADSDEAVGVVAAAVEPAEEGREVVLEAKSGAELAEEQATAEQDADGRVEFLLPAGGLDAGSSYRVSSPGGDGVEAAASATLAGDTWGDPEFDDEFDGDEISADWANRGEGDHAVSRTPSSTDRPRPSWTRTRYGATGTPAAVEGISIQGTGHSLPMAGMLAYSITFLRLDTTTTVPD